MSTEGHMVWIDLEMTGLDPETDTIIEIATLVTDADLEIVAEGPDIVIDTPDEKLDGMDAWNVEHHTKSGLLAAIATSNVSLAEAERRTLEFLRRHVPENRAPLCGNSIWQDRRFLHKYMPDLAAHLHYRSIDVSSLKELAKRWYPDAVFSKPNTTHRALDDIRQSVAELAHYRDAIFAPKQR